MSQNINDFFKTYATNFAKQNIPNIVNAYSFPMCFYTPMGTSVVVNEEDCYKNCEELVSVYESLGMNNPKHEIISTKKLNPGTSLVEIRWDFFEENEKIVSFTTIYILGESDDTVKILGVFEVDEYDKINELKTAKNS